MTSKDITIAKAIGQTIAKYRKAKGLSQEKVAELMSLSNDAISRMERGTITLSVTRLYEFAEILDCRAADLLTESSLTQEDQNAQINLLLQRLSISEREQLIEILQRMISWKLKS